MDFSVFPISSTAEMYISSKYGWRTLNGGEYHKGIDYAPLSDKRKGVHAIVAVNAGTVVEYVHNSSSAGNYVSIAHSDGSRTCYLHMDSLSTDIRGGSQVSAGTFLGYMGTSGQSTGVHLHFDVSYSSKPSDISAYLQNNRYYVDPTPYLNSVSPSTTVIDGTVSSSVASSTSGTTYSSSNYTDTALSIVGRRVSDVTSQPMHAFVNIYVGSNENDRVLISTDPPKPNILQSFTFHRLESAGSTAEMVLFDNDWDSLEEKFAANWDHIYLEYGYTDGVRSDLYHMMLQDYSISFNNTGVVLSIKAISESAYTNLTTVDIDIKEGTRNPTDAIRQICVQVGWNPAYLEETADLDYDISEVVSSVSENPVTYILSEILPLVVTDGEDPLTFYVDENNKAHLKRKSAAPTNLDSMRTYIFQKGYDSVVKDLSFDYKGVFGGITFSPGSMMTGGRVNMIDSTSKESSTIKKTIGDVATVETTTHLTMSSQQSIMNLDASGYTRSQMNNRLYYYIKNSNSAMFTGTLTIVGDPSIELLDHIRLINITDLGYLHHTSGIYMVTGISTSMTGGELTTALTIIRSGDIGDGVELINAKSYVK